MTSAALDRAAPVSGGERIVALDVLRGFALLGILVMNVQSFSMISAAYMNPTAYGDLTGANRWVWVLSHLLTDQKMYGLFSMLFGAGILLMTARAEAQRGTSAALHYRRMAWLLVFGLLHAHLLWYGDILYTYALCGMIVYLFRRKSPGALIALAGVFFAIGSAIYWAIGWSMQFWPPEAITAFTHDAWRPTAEMVQQELDEYRGGWLTQMPRRMEEAVFLQTLFFILAVAWKTIGNMLLGMALFKAGVLTAERRRGFYLRLSAAGFLLGLPVVAYGIWRNFAAGWDVRYSFFVGSQYNYWGAIVVDLGWIGLWMLVCTSSGFTRVKEAVGAVGRTAFSNYILQTVVATTIFYGHGFGLFGSVSRVGQILICVAVWAVQLVIALLWLRHFEYGPLEWLWRSLTYWRRMPMRRRDALAALIGALVVAVSLTATPVAQRADAPRNDLPQPYRTTRDWGQLPPGVKWAAVTASEPAPDGTIYIVHRCVANSCAGRNEAPILKFDAGGKLLESWGAGLFIFPHGATVDRDGNLWVTDARGEGGKGHQVFKFSPKGNVIMTLGKAGVAGSTPDLFDQPTDVVVAPSGDIFVTDSHRNGRNNRVVRFTADGTYIKEWGRKGSGPGELSEPHTIAIDSRGRLFVGDRENNRIQIFDQDGRYLDEWRQFGRPSGIFITSDDMIYVTDSESGPDTGAHELAGVKKGIRIGSARDGTVTAFIEDSESTAPDHSGAEGVGVDARGNVYGAVVRRQMLERHVRK